VRHKSEHVHDVGLLLSAACKTAVSGNVGIQHSFRKWTG